MISVVIPLYNEAKSLEPLHDELRRVFESAALGAYEVVFVDDGSRDGSWSIVEQIAARDPRVRGIRFRRNFGKAAALDAGFRDVRGDVVFTLDADLQDDPAEIPRFLARLGDDLDLVSGWKRTRRDPWHKVIPSRVFNAVVSSVTRCRLHDHNCGFKAYRRAVVDEISLRGELHRFVPALAQARGFRVGEVEVNHRPRQFGKSKYGVTRFVKGLLDLVSVYFNTHYGYRPLHACGTIALAFWALSAVAILAWPAARLIGLDAVSGTRCALVAATSLIVGAQAFATGLLAEWALARDPRSQDAYSVIARIDHAPTITHNE